VRLASFQVSPSARRELIKIFAESFDRFGDTASLRYEALVEQAMVDLIQNPERPGIKSVDGRIHYHLRHSRNRVSGGRVRAPRHILVCKIAGDELYVLAVAHDTMEEGLARRIEEGEGA
jgi:toxin ParE1/3/4